MSRELIIQVQVTVRKWPGALQTPLGDLGVVTGAAEAAHYLAPPGDADNTSEAIDEALRGIGLTPAIPDSDGVLRPVEN